MKKKDKKSSGKTGGDKANFDKYLRGLNRHLDKAKEQASSGGYEEFEDGKYVARAVDAKIGVSKSKRVQVVITWKFAKGDYKGKEKLDFEGLTEDHLPYLLKKLDAMGYDTAELEDLEAELKEILADIKKTKPICKIVLKTKGEFQNVYVNGPLGDEDADEDDEEDADEDEDKPKSKKKGKSKSDDDEEEDGDDDATDESDDDDDDSDGDDDDDDGDDDDDDEDDDEDEEDEPKKKKGKKSKSKSDDEDEEDDESDDEEEEVEDEVDVQVGSRVTADTKKYGKVKGEVTELNEAENKVTIKTDKGKTIKIGADKITAVEEAAAESVPKKSKKSKK